MTKLRPIIILASLLLTLNASAQIGIGKWREHVSFNRITQLAASKSRIYAAGANAICYYDVEDWTTGKLTKINALSDVGISSINYDNNTHTLLIAYQNGNIDLLVDDMIYNLSDIKRSNITGDKTIYSITFHNQCAYLSCGFGIVVVDLTRKEIKDTYYLGANGTTIAIHDIVFTDSLVVAATNEGLMTAPSSERFLNIAERWKIDTATLPRTEVPSKMLVCNNKLVIVTNTFDPDIQGFYLQGNGWQFDLVEYSQIHGIKVYDNKLYVSKWSVVDIYNSNMQKIRSVQGDDTWAGMQANDAISVDDTVLWVAHNWAGLVSYDMDARRDAYPMSPKGPYSDNNYKLVPAPHKMLICPGGKQTTNANMGIAANIYTFQNNEWDVLKGIAIDSITDIVDVTVDPLDTTHLMAASWGKGILEIRNNSVVNVYNETNTQGALQAYVKDRFRSLRTGGVTYDAEGNLWITNSLVSKGLVVRHTDGSWQGFNTQTLLNESTGAVEIDKILYDSINGYLLFSGKGNTTNIYVSDNKGRMTTINPNNGSRLNTFSVNCYVQDQAGDIWIGTNTGIKVIYDLYKAFNNYGSGKYAPVTCNNIIISEDDITEYLMAYENVTSIVVDGANRKWVGTAAGGLYLISSTGLEELAHFTTANSPLFSNKIVTLAIEPYSGELFVGTDKGTLSYRTTATYAETQPLEHIYAFPNPVKPGYSGPIAIKGFTRNAMVHITDASGKVVFSTQALGGQAIWNGRTNSGRSVASGVYYVFAADEAGNNKSVTKILVIR